MKNAKIDKIILTYIQDEDGNDEVSMGTQMLEITVQPTLLGLYHEGKNDHYFILKTDRWAMDSIEELNQIFKDVLKRSFE